MDRQIGGVVAANRKRKRCQQCFLCGTTLLQEVLQPRCSRPSDASGIDHVRMPCLRLKPYRYLPTDSSAHNVTRSGTVAHGKFDNSLIAVSRFRRRPTLPLCLKTADRYGDTPAS